MSLVVFLKAANVGGTQVFKPSQVAKELSDFEVVNIGAAGTFVVLKKTTKKEFDRAFKAILPINTDPIYCTKKEFMDLIDLDPFGGREENKDSRGFISILDKKPRTLPKLPATFPEEAGKKWHVELQQVHGRFVTSWWQRMGDRLLYPNEVVKKQFPSDATTRNWTTFLKIAKVVGSPREPE